VIVIEMWGTKGHAAWEDIAAAAGLKVGGLMEKIDVLTRNEWESPFIYLTVAILPIVISQPHSALNWITTQYNQWDIAQPALGLRRQNKAQF
jgi:hypothetical protein